jgi:ABC-type enterochelin transport system substrate-binding protein
MRTPVLDYLNTNLTNTIKVSQEQPFDEKGTSVYLKNLRRVYLEEPTIQVTTLANTFDRTNSVMERVTTIKGYLAVDAKNRNNDLDTALTILANARNVSTIANSFRREFDYSVDISNSVMIYNLEYRFHNLTK